MTLTKGLTQGMVPGSFFYVPDLIFSMDLSPGEICTYIYLRYRENRKTFQCWPSYGDIGNAIGRDRKAVKRYVSALEEKCLISTEHTHKVTKEGVTLNGNLMYTIRPIRDALESYYQRQFSKLETEAARVKMRRSIEKYNQRFPNNPIKVTYTDPAEDSAL